MHEYNERQLHRKRVVSGILIGVLLLALFAGVVWALHWWEESTNPADSRSPGVTRSTIRQSDALYELRDDLETFLIIGIDKYEDAIDESVDGYRNNQQADFLLLLVMDRTNKQCSLLHINRDTISQVPVLGVTGEVAGVQTEQLALAHTYGSGGDDSCRNTMQAVSAFLLGMPIDHYVAITMDAVAVLNDAVGGVEVEVLDDFSNVDASLVKGQTVTLHGSQALTYVRARYGMDDPTNVNRMTRQRQYMNALQAKLIDHIRSDGDFSLNTALALSEYMLSDCTAETLSKLTNRVVEYGLSDILTIDGEAKKGEKYMEFYADQDSLEAVILALFYRPTQSLSGE